MAVEWFYELDGFRRGPVASGELKKLAESGAITPDTLIWRDGLEEQVKAGAVRGLFPTTSTPTAQSQPAALAPSTATPMAPPALPQPRPQYASPPAVRLINDANMIVTPVARMVAQVEAEAQAEVARRMNDANMIVTTGDIKRDYEILGPVYFQVSNKGIFSSTLSKLANQYSNEIAAAKKQGQVGAAKADWGFLYGEFSVGQSDYEKAFFVAVQELKKRASILGADAIVGMRQDIDIDTNAFQFFYLQMYGTAVRMT